MKFSLGLLLFLLTLSACGTARDVSTGAPLLIVVEGVVKIKRDGRSDFQTATTETLLLPGDQIWPDEDATAQVMCDDLSTRTVTAGVPSGINIICPSFENPMPRNDGSVSNSRDGDPQTPYIIRPRATMLLSQTPILRWNNTGAFSYTVHIYAPGFEWQQAEVLGTELVYPGVPPLGPGVFYNLIVADSKDQVSSNHPELAFKILDETKQAEVQATVDAINQVDTISPAARGLILFQFYWNQALFAEATDLIQALIAQGNQSAAVYQALGDSYTQVGLAHMAEEPYLKALELAKQENNTEVILAVQFSLGKFYDRIREVKPAIEYLEAARSGYEALGVTGKVTEIDEILSKLK